MRTMFLFAVLGTAGVSIAQTVPQVHGFAPPSESDLKALNKDLRDIQILIGVAPENNAKTNPGMIQIKAQIKEEEQKIEPDRKVIAGLSSRLQALEKQRSDKCDAFLLAVARAYQIRSAPIANYLVTGKLRGSAAVWWPKSGDMDMERVIETRNGKITLRASHSYSAITWANGDIVVPYDSFTFSPGFVAALLAHETIHFDQLTTKGLGDKMSPALMELRAYRIMQGVMADEVFGLQESEKKIFEASQDKALREIASSPGAYFVGSVATEPVEDLAHLKTAAGDEFYGSVSDPAIPHEAQELFDSQEAQAKHAADALRLEAALKKADDDRRAFAKRLGFIEIDDPKTEQPIGFKQDMNFFSDWWSFNAPAGRVFDTDQSIVAVGLARSCYDVIWAKKPGPLRGSGDALAVLKRRWGEPDFRAGLVGATKQSAHNLVDNCMDHIIGGLKPPVDLARLQKAFDDYVKWQIQENRRLMEAEHRSRQREPSRRPAPSNPGREPSYPRSPGGCQTYDLCGHPGIGGGLRF